MKGGQATAAVAAAADVAVRVALESPALFIPSKVAQEAVRGYMQDAAFGRREASCTVDPGCDICSGNSPPSSICSPTPLTLSEKE